MKRRTFIISSAVAAVTVPVVYYFKSNKWKTYNPVYVPFFLSSVCDEATIKAIGKAFIKQRPAENSKQKLKTAVLTQENGGLFSTATSDAVVEFIHSKISSEFNNNKTVLADGWILSETEARQCALFSLTY